MGAYAGCLFAWHRQMLAEDSDIAVGLACSSSAGAGCMMILSSRLSPIV